MISDILNPQLVHTLAQVRSVAVALDLDPELAVGWLRTHPAGFDAALEVTVDNRLDNFVLRGFLADDQRSDVLRQLPDSAVGRFAAQLGRDAWRAGFELRVDRGNVPGAPRLTFRGDWGVDVVQNAWRAAGWPPGDLMRLDSFCEAAESHGVSALTVAGERVTLAFGLAIESDEKERRLSALVELAESAGATQLQLVWLRGILDSFTPREINFLTLVVDVVDGQLAPGVGFGISDVPESWAAAAIQTGALHAEPGAVFGAVVGAANPPRSVAADVVCHTRPVEPAIVTATIAFGRPK